MTSPDPKSQAEAEGGGMLPALLAGAGILAVAALFIFGGDDDGAKTAVQTKDKQGVNAGSSNKAGDPKGGIAERRVDGANETARPKPKLNPRIANAVVTEGMAPTPHKEPVPESFPSTEAEIEYWEGRLVKATNLLESRERSSEHVPKAEARIRENGTPEELADFERRREIVASNLQRAQNDVAEIEARLAELRGEG